MFSIHESITEEFDSYYKDAELTLKGLPITDEDVKPVIDYVTDRGMPLKKVSIIGSRLVGRVWLEVLSKTLSVQELCFKNCYIYPTNFRYFDGSATLTSLQINNNGIDDIEVETFLRIESLRRLDLCGNSIGSSGAINLSQSKNITELYLDSNYIDDKGAEALLRSRYLSILSLANNRIIGENLSLSKASSIRKLVLDNNKINDDACARICSHLKVTDLSLNDNCIGDKAMEWIVRNNSIVDLRLSGNFISDRGASIISETKNIRKLSLCDNKIGNYGAKALALNTSIAVLDIDKNHKIDNDGAREFLKNTSLTSLKLPIGKGVDECVNDEVQSHISETLEKFKCTNKNNIEKLFENMKSVVLDHIIEYTINVDPNDIDNNFVESFIEILKKRKETLNKTN